MSIANSVLQNWPKYHDKDIFLDHFFMQFCEIKCTYMTFKAGEFLGWIKLLFIITLGLISTAAKKCRIFQDTEV